MNGPKSLLSRIGRRMRKASASVQPSATTNQGAAPLSRPRTQASPPQPSSVKTTLLQRMNVKGRPLMDAYRRDIINR